jgi:hypothetical protein
MSLIKIQVVKQSKTLIQRDSSDGYIGGACLPQQYCHTQCGGENRPRCSSLE